MLINRNPYFWAGFHILLGILATQSKWIFIVWFFLCFLLAISTVLKSNSQNKLEKYLALIFYLISFELLARLCKSTPFVPYETSKYLQIFFCLLGLLFLRYKSFSLGFIMIFLIIPAFFYDLSGLSDFSSLVFNGFAPLGLAIGVAYFGNIKIDLQAIHTILRLLWYTSLASLAFVFFKTPDLETISFGFGANFETTGGESSNQVSSVLGLGMVLSFYSWLFRLNFSGHRIGDLLIMSIFGFQGLLTFSRGGIFVGLLAVLFIYSLSNFNNLIEVKKNRKISIYHLIIIVILGIFIFQQVDDITGGKISLRYQGETEGTFLGQKEKTLNVLTSNRFEILLGDLELWQENLMGGVGVGASKYLRSYISANPHVEFSRLLAEHGILGLLYIMIIIYLGIRLYRNNSVPQIRMVLLTLFLIGLLTSFHSAMRTFITPLFIAVSTVNPLNLRNKK
jgi:hypothetical protein